MGAGADKSLLGRWTWARYRGENGITLRVASIYRPTLNVTGCLSIWSQHKAYFHSINDDRDPRQAFMQDLETEAKSWLDAGDQLIIGGDLNDDIFSQDIRALFEDKLHLKDLIYTRHPQEKSPATYARNGSHKTIDGLWGTHSIQVDKCGYLEADAFFPGDHATLWADITINSALGGPLQEPTVAQARRLTLQDSKSVKKYLQCYKRLAIQYNLFYRQFALEASITPGYLAIDCPSDRS